MGHELSQWNATSCDFLHSQNTRKGHNRNSAQKERLHANPQEYFRHFPVLTALDDRLALPFLLRADLQVSSATEVGPTLSLHLYSRVSVTETKQK